MAESSMSTRKVLLPFDGSRAARRALEYVAAVADRETHVHLLNVQSPTIDDGVYLDPLVREGEQMLLDASRHLEAKAISHTSQVAIGWPTDAIVRSARSESCTAIVMGVRGAIARLFSGSVSRGVVRQAGVPVTLVSTSGEAVVRMP
jgi:nucleotide-binding universal stress UspA family protein